MSDNNEELAPDNTAANEMAEATPQEIVPSPAARLGLSPEKLAEMEAKIAAFTTSRGKTASGSEAPAEHAVATTTPEGNPIGETPKGSEVDWSEYDLEYGIKHLYKSAMFRDTSQGPKWVVMLDEYYTTTREARNHGKMVNVPGGAEGEQEPLNLGEYLTQTVNGREGWSVAAILPGQSGQVVVVLKRESPMVLPDPVPLKKSTEVAAPTDPELQIIEDAAIDFMKEEGLTTEAPIEDTGSEGGTLIPVPADQVEVEESGAIVASDRGAGVRHALDLNAAETIPPPVASNSQPAAVESDNPRFGREIPAGVENIRRGLPNLLDGPDFGEV